MIRKRDTSFGRLVMGIAVSMVCVGCSSEHVVSVELSLKEADRIIVEIDAMEGAVPSFAPLHSGVNPWLVFEKNIQALAPTTLRELTYPISSKEVGLIDIPSRGKDRMFSDDDIRTLAARHQDLNVGSKDALFHVLFLDGSYAENTAQARARSVNLGGTRIIAMFGTTSPAASDHERFIEMSALLHEFGHAVGLVDLLIPDISGHADPESPGHCSEHDCVMQGTATFLNSAHQLLQAGIIPILFGPDCLKDVDAYYGEP